MKTRLLYYKDQYKKEFSAEVVRVDKEKEGWSIVLDQTCFYPEGGGQPADRGQIDGIDVYDVRKKDGIVYHFTASKPERDSGSVSCSIDWQHRFDYMQQHTGQHIISGVLHEEGIGTVSVHQGEQYTSIETDQPAISDEDLDRIEEEVNLVISKNAAVRDYQVTDKEIPSLHLRRPPKVTGSIRIVELEGYDRAACGGVHTAATGEVVFAKILFTEKIRGHIRIAWILGSRVFRDYRQKQRITQRLSDLFSAPAEGIVPSAEKLLEENRQLKKRIEELLTGSAEKEVSILFSGADKIGGISVITKEYMVDDKTYLKKLLSVLPRDGLYAVCLVNKYRDSLQWALAVTADGFNEA